MYMEVCVVYMEVCIRYMEVCVVYMEVCVVYMEVCRVYGGVCRVYGGVCRVYGGVCRVYGGVSCIWRCVLHALLYICCCLFANMIQCVLVSVCLPNVMCSVPMYVLSANQRVVFISMCVLSVCLSVCM